MEAEEIIKEYQRLAGERQVWEAHWQNLAYYFSPTHDIYNRRSDLYGARQGNYDLLYSMAGLNAAEEFAINVHGVLTNNQMKWFYLDVKDYDRSQVKEVKEWIGQVEEIIRREIDHSNFYSVIFQAWWEIGIYGTTIVYAYEYMGQVYFENVPLWDAWISQDSRGFIQKVFRKISMSKEEYNRRFKTKTDDRDHSSQQEIEVLHAAINQNRKQKKQVKSYWISLDTKKIIKESHFYEMPYIVGVWSKDTGSVQTVYGKSPAMKALPNVRLLQHLRREHLKALHLRVSPPVVFEGPFSTTSTQINIKPKAIIQLRQGERITPLDTVGDLQSNSEEINRATYEIKEAFFAHLFNIPPDSPTATQTLTNLNEKLAKIAPILALLSEGFLSYIIELTYKILERRNVLPPRQDTTDDQTPGDEITPDTTLRIEFLSPVAIIERSKNIPIVQNFMAITLNMAQAYGDILDNIDSDVLIREIAHAFKLPEEILKSPSEVEETRQQRRAIEQAQQTAELAKTGSQALNQGTQAIGNLRSVRS